LLAAISVIPFTVIGYGLLVYFSQHTCRLGILCQMDTWPGWIQVLLIVLGFGFLWVILLAWGVAYGVEGDTTGQGRIAAWLRALSQFAAVRWLLVGGGVVALALLGWDAINLRLDVPGAAFGVITLIVAACTLFYRPPRDRANLTPQQLYEEGLRGTRSFWYVLRTIPPMRWIIPPHMPAAPQQQNPQNPQNP